jgi:hypothetical protein
VARPYQQILRMAADVDERGSGVGVKLPENGPFRFAAPTTPHETARRFSF